MNRADTRRLFGFSCSGYWLVRVLDVLSASAAFYGAVEQVLGGRKVAVTGAAALLLMIFATYQYARRSEYRPRAGSPVSIAVLPLIKHSLGRTVPKQTAPGSPESR